MVKMYTITREFHLCYGHRLLHHNGKCAHPHGHNGKIEVTLGASELDKNGMILDFTDLKNSIGVWIDEHLDHQMILAEDDPLVPVMKKMNEPMFLMEKNPTAENLAELIFDQVKKAGFPVICVVFWETEKCNAAYHA